MRELSLQAENREQERVLAYLQENATEALAEKIGKGTPITKDGMSLIRKKTLAGFMKYASEQARKQAAKGASYAMIDDDVVFGWAMHYFEEDSIEGELFTFDGQPYKTVIAPKTTPTPTTAPKPKKETSGQQSMFDLFDSVETPQEEEVVKEESEEIIIDEPPVEEQRKPKGNSMYQCYMAHKERYPDAIIAMRVGDFYEIFGEDAVVAGKAAELTITSRDCSLENRVTMVGFPYHTAEMYINKIVSVSPIVIADEDGVRYIQAPNEQVNLETGEVVSHKAYFDDENLYKLMRLIGNVEVRL